MDSELIEGRQALSELNLKYMTVRAEGESLVETNRFLEEKVRKLTEEN